MIGFNGGLIGKNRTYAPTGANSGVWTLDEILPIKRGVAATGGSEDQVSIEGILYNVHTFTSATAVKTFAVTRGGNVECLVVGGGGGGGRNGGGGGGGGGFRTANLTVTPLEYTITIGSGGAGASSTSRGTQGGSSTFSTITAAGGGGGGSRV